MRRYCARRQPDASASQPDDCCYRLIPCLSKTSKNGGLRPSLCTDCSCGQNADAAHDNSGQCSPASMRRCGQWRWGGGPRARCMWEGHDVCRERKVRRERRCKDLTTAPEALWCLVVMLTTTGSLGHDTREFLQSNGGGGSVPRGAQPAECTTRMWRARGAAVPGDHVSSTLPFRTAAQCRT